MDDLPSGVSWAIVAPFIHTDEPFCTRPSDHSAPTLRSFARIQQGVPYRLNDLREVIIMRFATFFFLPVVDGRQAHLLRCRACHRRSRRSPTGMGKAMGRKAEMVATMSTVVDRKAWFITSPQIGGAMNHGFNKFFMRMRIRPTTDRGMLTPPRSWR